MARVLIVGGGCRGLGLAEELAQSGHAVRVTTRREAQRAAIEHAGAQCWIGDPDRIATLRLALDGVTIACWLLANAAGEPEAVEALHASRLQFMLTQLIDTTVRGLIYEARGTAPAAVLEAGAQLARAHCQRNAIPLRVLDSDPGDPAAWRAGARAAVDALLQGAPATVAGR